MNKKIIEASNLPEGDKVYLKKDIFGWRIVQPIKDENGKINLTNLLFGGYRNLVILIILILAISVNFYLYNHDVTAIEAHYATISADPIAFCQNIVQNGARAADGTLRVLDNLNSIKILGGENGNG